VTLLYFVKNVLQFENKYLRQAWKMQAIDIIFKLPYSYRPGPYSQHFILSLTYSLDQLARVLHYIWMERLARDKHSSLLDTHVSYKENEVL